MQFPSTHWSEVLAARDSPRSGEALAALCRAYWAPLYAFIRRRGYDAQTAQDLAQDFFAQFLEKDYLAVVTPEKGKFRSFLLKAVSHFLANEWDRRHAKKRGGDRIILPLDVASAERQYGVEPAHDLTPEKIFEKRWALALLEQVLGILSDEYARRKQTVLFERLKDFLTGDRPGGAYGQAAAELGMTEAALRQAVHRLRQRYGDLLRREIAKTVASHDDVEDELRCLLAAVGR